MASNVYTITTYKELKEWADDFYSGRFYGLIIEGSAGLGKSVTFSQGLKQVEGVTIKGKLTEAKHFRRLAAAIDKYIMYDDVTGLIRVQGNIDMMMQLAEHVDGRKPIQYNVVRKTKEGEQEKTELIYTASRPVVILNDILSGSPKLEALYSRCMTVRFAPSKGEVHSYVGSWFFDPSLPFQEERKVVYKYIGENLHLIPQMDVRDYGNAIQAFRRDWKNVLQERWNGDVFLRAANEIENEANAILVKIEQNKKLKDDEKWLDFDGKPYKKPMTFDQKVERFAELCNSYSNGKLKGSRGTYNTYMQKLQVVKYEKTAATVIRYDEPTPVAPDSHEGDDELDIDDFEVAADKMSESTDKVTKEVEEPKVDPKPDKKSQKKSVDKKKKAK